MLVALPVASPVDGVPATGFAWSEASVMVPGRPVTASDAVRAVTSADVGVVLARAVR